MASKGNAHGQLRYTDLLLESNCCNLTNCHIFLGAEKMCGLSNHRLLLLQCTQAKSSFYFQIYNHIKKDDHISYISTPAH